MGADVGEALAVDLSPGLVARGLGFSLPGVQVEHDALETCQLVAGLGLVGDVGAEAHWVPLFDELSIRGQGRQCHPLVPVAQAAYVK